MGVGGGPKLKFCSFDLDLDQAEQQANSNGESRKNVGEDGTKVKHCMF